MKKIVVALALLPTLGFASDFHPYRLIVKMKPGMKVTSLKHVEKTRNLFGNVYVVHTSKLNITFEQLQNNPSLEYVQKDFKNKQKELAKVVLIQLQSYLRLTLLLMIQKQGSNGLLKVQAEMEFL